MSSLAEQKGSSRPVVVVTGASVGIGLALARKFVEQGHNVALLARNESRLAAACAQLQKLAGVHQAVIAFPLDVTGEDVYGELVQQLTARGFYVDVFINNAGIGLGGAFADHTTSEIANLVALNVATLTRLVHHAIADMRQRGHGHVINIASLGGYAPGPYQAAYYASKAYVLSLSEAVAHELMGSGVRLTVVAPGAIDTNFHAAMGAKNSFYRLILPSSSPERVAVAVYRGYRLGLRVIVPGIFNRLMMVAARIMPHPITVPLMGWLLKPRGGGATSRRNGGEMKRS
jgi:short-subunit dehydrogenase